LLALTMRARIDVPRRLAACAASLESAVANMVERGSKQDAARRIARA